MFGPNSTDPHSLAIGELNGKWQNAVLLGSKFPTASNTDSVVEDVSCWSHSSCTVYGYFHSRDRKISGDFVQTETNGRWGISQIVPDVPNGVWAPINYTDFSCTSMGNCLLGGFLELPHQRIVGAIDQEVDGKWTARSAGIGTKPGVVESDVNEVACPSPNLCVAAGLATFKDHVAHLFVQTESHGHWSPAHILSVNIDFGYYSASLSCATTNECYVVGKSYLHGPTGGARNNPPSQSFVVAYSHSQWTAPRLFNLGGDPTKSNFLWRLACDSNMCESLGLIELTAQHYQSVLFRFPTSTSRINK